MKKENWRPVVGFAGAYEVSDHGKVRSLFHHYTRLRPRPWILAPRPLPKGYLRVQLKGTDGSIKDYYIHRLVALAFIPNPKGLPYVNHLDGNRANNHSSNLEWCDQKQNLAHAVATGLMSVQKGQGNHSSKLSDKQALQIKRLFLGNNARSNVIKIAERFGVCTATVYNIGRGKSWKHLPPA